MANNIKGITIEIDADGTQLERAINDINKESQALSSELRTINNQLKFDPQNTVILQQKFDVLGEQIAKTKTKLETLESAQDRVKEMYENGEIDDGQYRAFQRELEKTENYLGNLEAQQEETAGALKQELSTEYENLQTSIQETTTHLEELQAQQDAMGDADVGTDAYMELSEEIASVTTELENLQSEADAVSSQMSDLDANAETLGINLEKAGGGANESRTEFEKTNEITNALSGAFQQAGVNAGVLGGAIGGLASGSVTELISVIGEVAEKVINLAMSFDEANSIIVEKTGAMGDSLAEFNDIARDTSMLVDNTDLTGVASTVGELSTRLDLEGQELRNVTYLMQQFADVTGTDGESAVVNISKVMKNWGVETDDIGSLLDKLTVAGQKTGISIDSLSSDLVTHKAQLQEMGYSLDESIALLSNFEKEGINSSRIMTGFNTAVGKWAKEGKNAKDGFAELSESIANASSNTEAITLATDYFGRRSAQELVYAIRTGRMEFDDLSEAIDNSNGVMLDTEERADTVAEKFDTFGRAVGNVALSGETLPQWFETLSADADSLGLSMGDVLAQTLFLNDAQKQAVEQYALLDEAETQNNEILAKQVELEQLASGGYETMSTNMDSIGAKIQELNEQYADNYETAYKNIDGSIGLFEDMTIKSGKSVDSMIGSLKSQVSYMDNYASNIKRAVELGVDKGLVQKLSDGSKESAEILQSIVDNGGEDVAELNEQFLKVEEGKKAFSDTYASMVTDFDTKMGQIEKRVELAEDSLDAYQEMYKDGANSVQGFINGANSKLESVKRAFKKLGETAQRETEKTWNMHSPSKVMEKYGEYVSEGFAIGILKELDVVEDAMSKLAPPNLKGMGDMAITKTSRVISVTAPIQVMQRLDDAEIQRMGGRITDIVGRQFAKRTGGTL